MDGKRFVLGVDHEGYEFACVDEETGELKVLFGGVIEKPGEPLIIGYRMQPNDQFRVHGCRHIKKILPSILFCPRCWMDPADCSDDHEQDTVTL